jgi:5,10-methylenetetrahydromethanopterin reductase
MSMGGDAMRIGLTVPTPPDNPDLETLLLAMERADALGLHAVWMPNVSSRGFDAPTALALGGARTQRIELGTFVVPTFTRHPVVMAQQALSAQAATAGRFVLGIGLSHRVSMEEQLGFDFSRPIRHMREYLTCLTALLEGRTVDFTGEEFRIRNFALTPPPGVTPPPILVAALGPQMLRLAGRLSAGTAIWVGGPRYVAEAAKAIGAAAREAGRPVPRVVASVPVCVTDHAGKVREAAAQQFVRYGQLPSYRAILDREGVGGPEEVALIGNEAAVRAGIATFADAGATDFSAGIFAPPGENAGRTLALLATLARDAVPPRWSSASV